MGTKRETGVGVTSKTICTIRAAAVFAAIALTLMASSSTASAAIEQCVAKKVSHGVDRTKAMAECLKDAADTTRPGLPTNASSDSGGTSTGLLVLVGLGGVALGAIAMMMLRKPSSAPGGAPSAQPALGANPSAMPPPGFAAPGAPAAATVDRSGPLVASLIDLGDRVSSGALRAEIIAALAQAGVHLFEPAQGAVFDVNHMRGVGSAQAPDPGWVGRVASTDRAGFVDGNTVVRLPDVVVYTAAG